MSKTLRISPGHKHVMCPSCSYEWWIKVYNAWEKTIHCPECKAPLLSPTIDIDLSSIEQSQKEESDE